MHRPSFLRSFGATLFLLAPAFAAGLAAQEAAPAASIESPFAGAETHVLSNGLRLWIVPMPEASDIGVGVVVPYGWDQDPRGKEELAHFTEHMLFGDYDGKTEEQILDEVESRGGRRNGITTPDHTFYYVTLPRSQGLFGVGWLGSVLEPKLMDPAVVERNRQPVALEIGARPAQLFDRVAALFRTERLRPPEYWEREFGLETRAARVYNRYDALQRITPEDLRDFYDRYYTPTAMTVIVAGDVQPEQARAEVEAAFGELRPRAAPPRYGPLTDPGRAFRAVTWSVRPNVRFQRVFKLYEITQDDHLRLLFLARYLDRRLGARLRFGPIKAVYGVAAQVIRRGPATHFLIAAPVDPIRWDYALGVIEEEMAVLAAGSGDADTFRADRAAVVERIVAENQEAENMIFWAHNGFNDASVHPEFPDVAAFFMSIEQGDLAELVGRMTEDRQATWIARPQPLSQGILLSLVLVLAWLTIHATRRLLVVPLDMRSIRYVARIQLSIPSWIMSGAIYLMIGAIVLRLMAAVAERVLARWVLPVDVYLFQTGVYAVAGMALLALAIFYLSLPPRKLLLFDDELRVKYLSFRSRCLPLAGTRVEISTWAQVFREGDWLQTIPFSLGLMRPAVWIRPPRGLAYLVRVRDPYEFVAAVEEAGGGSVQRRPEYPVELRQPARLVP